MASVFDKHQSCVIMSHNVDGITCCFHYFLYLHGQFKVNEFLHLLHSEKNEKNKTSLTNRTQFVSEGLQYVCWCDTQWREFVTELMEL